MAAPGPPEDALLIVGMIGAWPELFDRAEQALCARFGPVALASDVFAFDWTDYYEPEMGHGLRRKFCAFGGAFDPAALAEVKLRTNDLERDMAVPEFPVPRPINLDPGYVSLAKLVLATTKNRAHRIYLRDGIYAEITLSYHDGDWQPLPWTFPDYRAGTYAGFFRRVRERLMNARAAM